jgi:hypothetical protein
MPTGMDRPEPRTNFGHPVLARIIHGPVGEWHEARESRAHAVSQTRDGLLSRCWVEKRRTPWIFRWIVTCSPGSVNNPG